MISSNRILAHSYGMIAAQASGTLKLIVERDIIPEGHDKFLVQGKELLDEILSGKDFLDAHKHGATPTQAQVDAFDRALDVIISNSDDFKVKNINALGDLMVFYRSTLSEIVDRNGSLPPKENIEDTYLFFKRFNELMLPQGTHLAG